MSITDAEMDQMRAESERLAMPNRCSIITPGTAPTLTDDGSPSSITEAPGQAVPCRLVTNPQAQEILLALRLSDIGSSVLALPLGTMVANNSQIIKDGLTYEVLGTNAGESFATSLKVALKLVT